MRHALENIFAANMKLARAERLANGVKITGLIARPEPDDQRNKKLCLASLTHTDDDTLDTLDTLETNVEIDDIRGEVVPIPTYGHAEQLSDFRFFNYYYDEEKQKLQLYQRGFEHNASLIEFQLPKGCTQIDNLELEPATRRGCCALLLTSGVDTFYGLYRQKAVEVAWTNISKKLYSKSVEKMIFSRSGYMWMFITKDNLYWGPGAPGGTISQEDPMTVEEIETPFDPDCAAFAVSGRDNESYVFSLAARTGQILLVESRLISNHRNSDRDCLEESKTIPIPSTGSPENTEGTESLPINQDLKEFTMTGLYDADVTGLFFLMVHAKTSGRVFIISPAQNDIKEVELNNIALVISDPDSNVLMLVQDNRSVSLLTVFPDKHVLIHTDSFYTGPLPGDDQTFQEFDDEEIDERLQQLENQGHTFRP